MAEVTRTRGVGAEHDRRRREIVEAVLRLVARRGLEAVNLRDVGAEAGVSAGRVQHYFGTKNALITAAFEEINARGTARVQAAAARSDGSPRTILRLVAAELVPTDAEHREALQVGLAFTDRALVDPSLARQLRAGYSELHQLLVLLIRRGIEAGDIRAEVDPDLRATAFLGLAEGLGTHVLIGHRDADTALATIDAALDDLFDH